MNDNKTINLESINDDLFVQMSTADQQQLVGGATRQGTVNATFGPTGPDAQADFVIDFSADEV